MNENERKFVEWFLKYLNQEVNFTTCPILDNISHMYSYEVMELYVKLKSELKNELLYIENRCI